MPAGNKKDHAKMELPPQKILDIVKGEGFTVGDKIRPGSTSVICKASSTKVTVPLAVKIIDIKRLSKRYRAIYGPREITISKRVNHKNVIKTHKVRRHVRLARDSHVHVTIFVEHVTVVTSIRSFL